MALGLFWSLACLAAFFITLKADRMGLFSNKNRFPVKGKTVIVTGGSQGMGKEVARNLAAKGANVIIVARGVERLQEAVKYISEGASDASQRFHYISADLTNAAESKRLIAEAAEWSGGQPPDIVWSCHGSSIPKLFVDSDIADIDGQMQGNFLSTAYLAHATLNAWLKPEPAPASEPRHLVFTSSFVALFPITGYGPYSPSKAAMRSLYDTLSMELALYENAGAAPVRTHIIYPGTIYSEGFEKENAIKSDVTKKLEEDDTGQTPDEVAKSSIQQLEAGHEMITTTWISYLVMCSVLGGSRRSGLGILDTIVGIISGIILLFVRSDLEGKTRAFGKANGQSGMKKQ